MDAKKERPVHGQPRLFPILRRVPEMLRAWPHWVNWRANPAEKGGVVKYRKIPIDPNTGRNARTNDPKTWAPFDAAAARWAQGGPDAFPVQCAGVGVILGEHGGVRLVGMDFDGCVTDGTLDADIAAIIAQLPGYAEFSPSGRGVKVFWFTRVDLGHLTRTGKDAKGRGREFYCGSPRYFAVTGRALEGRGEIGEVVDESWADMLDRSIADVVADCMADVEGRASGTSPRLVAVDGQVVDESVDPDEAFLLGMNDKPAGWTVERVKTELLSQVSADCSYDDWFRVCCALHHHGDGGEEWFEAFDEWSQSAGDRYPGEDGPDGTRAKWESVGGRQRGQPVTLRSLIRMARAAAVAAAQDALASIATAADEAAVRAIADRLCHHDLDPVDREKAAAAIKKRLKELGVPLPIAIARGMVRKQGGPSRRAVLDWAAELIYVEDENRWYGPRGNSYSPDSLNMTFASKAPLLPPPLSGRMSPVKYVAEEVGEHIPKARSRRFRPDLDLRVFEEDGDLYLNSYTEGLHQIPTPPAEYSPADRAAIARIEDHLAWLLPDERERRLLKDVLCWIVQNPGQQLRWMPLLVGPVGAGKSFFEVLLREVIGKPEWVTVVSHEAFAGRFNGWAEGSLVVILSEVRFPSDSSRYAMMDKLKPLLTDRYVSVEAKGKDSHTVRNTASYFAMSNHDDAIPLGNDTRRVMVLSVELTEEQIKERSAAGYFEALFASVDHHRGAVRRWMLEHNDWHPDFRPGDRAPETVARQEMMEATEDPLIEEVREALGQGGSGFGEGAALARKLTEYLRQRRGGMHLDERRVRLALRQLGYKTGPLLWFSGTMVRPYLSAGIRKKFPENTEEFRLLVRGILTGDDFT